MPASDLVVQLGETDIATITLNRPAQRNALTREMLSELLEALRWLAQREELRGLVLRSSGPVFCAGMDLGQMQATVREPDAAQHWQADARSYRDVLQALWSLNVPTLAAVQGPVVAGGVGLVLACDLVLASTAASFALPEPKRGLTAAIVLPLLLYRVSTGAASYLAFSGRALDAQAARAWGVCHETIAPDALESRTREVCEAWLQCAPGATRATKHHFREFASGGLIGQWERSVGFSAAARETDEAREGLQAFLENRPPHWNPPTTTS